jgi:YVTN family beta-propeller protein
MAGELSLKVFLAGRVAVETDEVVIDEARFPGRQGRLLFAYLVAEQGRPVPRDELAEALWGEALPASWDKSLTVIASKLRNLLADGGLDGANALTGAFGCYRLDLPEGTWVDVIAAANAVQEAEEALAAGDLDEARAAATLAASLVRQPFLPGEDGTWVEERRRELTDARGGALNVLADACLRSGDAREGAKWAEQAVALEPFRETGYRRLMEAHVAAGNRAEALRVYERCRRLLAEELGAYPSPETESIYRGLLERPSVQTEVATAPELPQQPVAPPVGDLKHKPGSAFARYLASRRGVMAAAAIGALTAAAVAGILATRDGSSHVALIAGDSVGVVDSHSGRFVADVGVGATPTHIAVGEGAIWVTSADDQSVSRIDPVTKARVETITVGSSPSGIAVGNGAVWVANSLNGTVSRIDPATNSVVQRIDVGNGPVGIIYARGSIWVANTVDNTITRIDADSGKPTKTLQIAAIELAYGAGALWASQRGANQVARIDPSTGDVIAAITVGNGPTGIAVGDGAVWVANSLDGTVTRINPETNTVAETVPTVGNGPTGVAVDSHGVWVTNQFRGTLVRIDPRTNKPAQPIAVGNRPRGVAVAGGDVLVAVRDSGAGHRGGTLTLRSDLLPHTNPIDSIDTAVSYSTYMWPLLRMTGDGLVAYNQVSGLAGTQLVPDLAVSLPAPTDRGKTYTFRLRPGIHYSNDRPVEASDFRPTFERDFKIGSPVAYYDGIVGAARCRKRPKRCDLSRGIVADDAARTVAFHLVAPDPEFLYKLAIPFAYVLPAGTPPRDTETRPLPATGPYVIATYKSRRLLRLVRNRYFREWSQAAQPDGYPDQIVLRMAGTADQAIGDVIRAKADLVWTAEPFSQGQVVKLETQHASQVRANPGQLTQGLFLNTRVPPFDQLDVRRALNYAADRAAAIQANGGSTTAQPTCQILPPDFPGYRSYCPYTAGSTTRGGWTAPDLTRARALVAHSGTRGMKVTVWAWTQAAGFNAFAVKLLRSLGYRVSTKVLGDSYFAAIQDSRNKAQIGFAGWQPDYPSASAFFRPLFSCAAFMRDNPNNLNAAEFCAPKIDRQIELALREQTTNPSFARELWERVDREITDQAPWVPLFTPKWINAWGADIRSHAAAASSYSRMSPPRRSRPHRRD